MGDFLKQVSRSCSFKGKGKLFKHIASAESTPQMSSSKPQRMKKKYKVESTSNSIDRASKSSTDISDARISLFKSSQIRAEAEMSNESTHSMEQKQMLKIQEELALYRKSRSIHVYGNDIPDPARSFKDMVPEGDFEWVSHAIDTNFGFKTPTPIQSQLVPIMMSERDCLAAAPTGSGKTVAFLLPLLLNVKKHTGASRVEGFKGIVVSPTNELAAQIYRECLKLSEASGVHVTLLSKDAAEDIKKKHEKNKFSVHEKKDLLITTPLKLVQMLKDSEIQVDKVEWLVLDECDKLLDLGLQGQVDEIMNACGKERTVRKVMVSATLPPSIEELAVTVLNDHIKVIVGQKNGVCADVAQKLVFCGREEGKLLAIRNLGASGGLKPPVLIFVQSKERAKQLFIELEHNDLNIPVEVIHADQPLHKREEIVKNFRIGKTWILICTELMARGIDFKAVNCVINYDFPQTTASYVHRVGRTGRAGRKGEAYTLFTESDTDFLRSIANVMRISGCDVPDWMLQLKTISQQKRKRLETKPPKRKPVSKEASLQVKKEMRKKKRKIGPELPKNLQ